MDSAMHTPLLDRLSNELIFLILAQLAAFDLPSVSQSCWTLRNFIKGNKLLHKEIYLAQYDDPSHVREPDWEEELHRNGKLEKILLSEDERAKRAELEFAAERIEGLLDAARSNGDESRNLELLTEYFEGDSPTSKSNRSSLLCASSLFDQGGFRSQRPASTPELQQLSAKLHCLWGRPLDPVPYSRARFRYGSIRLPRHHILGDDDDDELSSPAMNTRMQTGAEDVPVHMVARGKVYDLSEYTLPSLWGPFMEDGSHRVDWEKVEAVMSVLGFNLSKFTTRSEGRFPYVWQRPWIGATPNSFIPPPPTQPGSEEGGDGATPSLFEQLMQDFDAESTPEPRLAKQPDPALESQDPYGVTGTWMRIVCFLDYNDLYHYNFHSELGPYADVDGKGTLRRRPIDTEEGSIPLVHCLRVTKIEAPKEDEREDWDEKPDPDFSQFKGKRLPVVHFTGDSRSLHASWDPNANSKIRGTVRQTPEGAIRWTTFSIFHGEERWRSEGIQIGGLRSARGVLGNWFDKDFDQHGPAGPTAFWKESGGLGEGEGRRGDGVVAFF